MNVPHFNLLSKQPII